MSYPDPGWRPVLRYLPLLLVPVLGIKRMAAQTSGLTSLRLLWARFVIVLALLWLPVLLLGPDLNGPLAALTAMVLTAVGGVFAQLLAPRLVPTPDLRTSTTLVDSYQRATLIRVALAGVAALIGFVLFVASGSSLVYGVGFVVSLAGMIDAAPRTRRFAVLQIQADSEGLCVDVVAALDTHRLTRG